MSAPTFGTVWAQGDAAVEQRRPMSLRAHHRIVYIARVRGEALMSKRGTVRRFFTLEAAAEAAKAALAVSGQS